MLEFWGLDPDSCQFMCPSLQYDFFANPHIKGALVSFFFFLTSVRFYDADGTKDIL